MNAKHTFALRSKFIFLTLCSDISPGLHFKLCLHSKLREPLYLHSSGITAQSKLPVFRRGHWILGIKWVYISYVFFVFAAKSFFRSFLSALLAQYRYIKKMPLANGSSSLLTNHGNHGNRTDNSSLPLYRKFRFRQASDFDWEYKDAQNRHRCWTMQAYWDKKAECLRRKMYL